MRATFRTGVTAALCAAAAATTFAGDASAGPIGIASSPVIKAPSATEQIYYRRYGGRYYRRGYAYGPRYYYGRPAYGYGYGRLSLCLSRCAGTVARALFWMVNGQRRVFRLGDAARKVIRQ